MPHDSEVLSLLRIKLAYIDQDCEGENRASVTELERNVRYEGGRLHVPDPQKMANLLLRVISCKEKRFNAEISRILSASGVSLRPEELDMARELVGAYFQEDRYVKRFDRFVESVGIAASRYGLKFDPQVYRVDLASALFSAGVKNGTRRGLASVHAELAIHVRKQPLAPETETPGINDIVDLKPNFMGLGVNLNALIRRYCAKIRKGKSN